MADLNNKLGQTFHSPVQGTISESSMTNQIPCTLRFGESTSTPVRSLAGSPPRSIGGQIPCTLETPIGSSPRSRGGWIAHTPARSFGGSPSTPIMSSRDGMHLTPTRNIARRIHSSARGNRGRRMSMSTPTRASLARICPGTSSPAVAVN